MTGPRPGSYAGRSSSSAAPRRHDRSAVDDLDGDESADLGQESALLADDPLEDHQERIPCAQDP